MKRNKIVLLIAWIFEHAGSMVPMKKVGQNQLWLAYQHPKPTYPVHFIFVPKHPRANLELCPFDTPEFSAGLISLVSEVIARNNLSSRQCKLVLNGGKFQTFPIAHAHLISV